MKEFFEMSGYGAYVWSAYAIAMSGLWMGVWRARRQQRDAVREARRRLAMQEKS